MSKAKSDNSQLADRRLKPLDPYSSTSTIPHSTPESQEKRVENSEINIADYWNNATVIGTKILSIIECKQKQPRHKSRA